MRELALSGVLARQDVSLTLGVSSSSGEILQFSKRIDSYVAETWTLAQKQDTILASIDISLGAREASKYSMFGKN